MPNQLHLQVKVKFLPSDAKRHNVYVGEREKYVTVSGDNYTNGIQSIGTATETVNVVSDVTTQGYVFAKNLDSTNYIILGGSSSHLPVKLKPKEFALFRINGTLKAKADTAACNLEYYVFED